MDFFGAFTLVLAVLTLLLGLDRGSNVSWSDLMTISYLAASLSLFIAFMFVEMRIASEPFAPDRIIFDKSLFACYLCNFLTLGGYMSLLFYLPLYLQVVNNLSAAQAGVRLLPGIMGTVLGSVLAGAIMQKTGKYYALTVAAGSALLIAMTPILLSTSFVSYSDWGVSIGLALSGLGNGISVTTTLTGLIANSALEDQAVVIACSYLFRSLGSVVGISVSTSVVQQALRIKLGQQFTGEDGQHFIVRVQESLDFIKTLDPEVAEIVKNCYETAISVGLDFILCIFMFAWISTCKYHCLRRCNERQ